MRALTLLATIVTAITVLIEAVALPTPPKHPISPPNPTNEEADKEAAVREANKLKYFHEPSSHETGSDDQLGHYDSRYFKGVLNYEDKRDTQVHMVRAYLDAFREKGIETWIAHGTLLGWWWNGKVCVLDGSLIPLYLRGSTG